MESYQALLQMKQSNWLKAVGVSNFAERHLIDLQQEGETPPLIKKIGKVATSLEGLPAPAVHQLEFHPAWPRVPLETAAPARAVGTIMQAYGCLGGAHTGAMLLQLELVQQIAQHHAASPAQVLYQCLGEQQTREEQDGAGYLEHLMENLDLFRFALTEEDDVRLELMDPGGDDDQELWSTARGDPLNRPRRSRERRPQHCGCGEMRCVRILLGKERRFTTRITGTSHCFGLQTDAIEPCEAARSSRKSCNACLLPLGYDVFPRRGRAALVRGCNLERNSFDFG
ncbi:1 [Durusdinium trenchii]|uniref:1 n=1 Tax=Durusdinium trenchii TaxID=1381693 RepID=A0ABP0HWH1_9DINO